MAQSVREETGGHSRLEDLVLVADKDAQIQEVLDQHLVRQEVDILPLRTGPDLGHALGLHVQNRVVDLEVLLGPLTVNRETSGHVGSVALPLGTGVDQHTFLTGHVLVVLDVVQRAAVWSRAADWVVSRELGSLTDRVIQELCVDVALVLLYWKCRHHCQMRVVGDFGSLAQKLDLKRVFDQPGLVQSVEEMLVAWNHVLGK
ncbi:hypothetical protein OGAPHI_005373 [Ogataea philodendri]|uniref:Uncharacterized protein n=1 Tax=Ogataea philodendri TaxID=1378263 RepID=A0A9P8P037_9ASCO|nr:uncharacterized protein OGAPHI_005373 [Ogataea philodendri]KAH3663383.1 hypothetical protein OGAPHI_005373 [Ogataea philodendri]